MLFPNQLTNDIAIDIEKGQKTDWAHAIGNYL